MDDGEASGRVPLSAGSARSRVLDVGPFRVQYAWFPPGLRLRPHLHSRGAVVVVLEGEMELGFTGRAYDCRSGTVVSEPVDAPHGNRFGRDGAGVLAVQPDHHQVAAYQPCAPILDTVLERRDAGIRALGWRLAHELGATDDVAPLAVHGLVLELLAAAARLRTPRGPVPPAWLEDVEEYLRDQYLDDVTLDRAAGVVGIHPAHVARVFRRHHGRSIGDFVRELRLDWAAHHVSTTDRPLVDVALDAGFADQSHFTRAFKARVGVPPGRYRRELRRGSPSSD